MLTLITGNVVSGKTSFALRRLLPLLLTKEYSSSARYFKNDMMKDSIERLVNFGFENCSIILLDEVYPLFCVSLIDEPTVLRFAKMLETHCHYGYQFVLIARDPSDIHEQIKVFVDEHHHVEHSFMGKNTVYRWNGVSNDLSRKDAIKTRVSLF